MACTPRLPSTTMNCRGLARRRCKQSTSHALRLEPSDVRNRPRKILEPKKLARMPMTPVFATNARNVVRQKFTVSATNARRNKRPRRTRPFVECRNKRAGNRLVAHVLELAVVHQVRVVERNLEDVHNRNARENARAALLSTSKFSTFQTVRVPVKSRRPIAN